MSGNVAYFSNNEGISQKLRSLSTSAANFRKLPQSLESISEEVSANLECF